MNDALNDLLAFLVWGVVAGVVTVVAARMLDVTVWQAAAVVALSTCGYFHIELAKIRRDDDDADLHLRM